MAAVVKRIFNKFSGGGEWNVHLPAKGVMGSFTKDRHYSTSYIKNCRFPNTLNNFISFELVLGVQKTLIVVKAARPLTKFNPGLAARRQHSNPIR